jgi:hypothetical protein
MNYYDITNIISYMDIDMMLIMRRMSNLFDKEIGQMKIHDDEKLINIGDKYKRFIGLRIGSYRISKEGLQTYGTLLNKQLYDACFSGNLDIVKFIIEKGVDDLNWGLTGACYGGHLDIVKFIMEKGVDDLNWGLTGACYGGHLDIVKFLIEKGANDWNRGLYGACSGRHLDIVKFTIEKGANDWNEGILRVFWRAFRYC